MKKIWIGQAKYHNGYSIKIHTYRYEYGAWEYENGVAHSSTRAVNFTKDIIVHTFGKGIDGGSTIDSYITQVNDECIIKELSEGGYKWID